jgi:hypothetical protein
MRHLLIAPLLLACTAASGAPDRIVTVQDQDEISVTYRGQTPDRGSGNRVRQTRPIGQFTRVIADDALDVEIAIGPRAAIELEGDDNLIDRIRTDAENGILHLRVRGGYRVHRPMVARITVPQLDQVNLEASGDARISGLDGGRLTLVGQGSGSFDADGAVDQVEVRINGSGNANLDGLRAREARILINGSGDARAHVVDTIYAKLNGTGEIAYRGRPRNVSEEVNGTGAIRRIGD